MGKCMFWVQLLEYVCWCFFVLLIKCQQLDICILYIDMLNEIVIGCVMLNIMWDWVSNVLIWLYVVEVLQLYVVEMEEQMQVVLCFIVCYQCMYLVWFDGVDYQLVKVGVQIMDDFVVYVDQLIVEWVVIWLIIRFD